MMDDDSSWTPFVDLLFLTLMLFITAVVLMLAHINPAAKNETTIGEKPPGSVIVEMTWDDDSTADVDLWVQAPGDVPVGYSNKGGLVFNLLRDDLGDILDASGINYETAYSRGMPGGEYVVNAHLFRADPSRPPPMEIYIRTSVRPDPDGQSIPVAQTTITLNKEGRELTAFRFKLDTEGNVIPSSLTTLYKPLRSLVPQ